MARRKTSKRKTSPWIPLAVIAAILLFTYWQQHRAQSPESSSLPGSGFSRSGLPGSTPVLLPSQTPSQTKDYHGFTLNFNSSNHTPNYVAWELLASETDGPSNRDNNFWQDPDIDGCPSTADYTRSGFDRGHIIPAADQKWHPDAMTDCFSMANMCPQKHELNAGAWKTLEEKERLWANRDSALIIIAGPIYAETDTRRIGQTGVRVPSGFFKVIYALHAPEPRAIAFAYPNDRAPGNMQSYSMPVDDLEALLGYDFLPELPDPLQSQIESTANFKAWNNPR